MKRFFVFLIVFLFSTVSAQLFNKLVVPKVVFVNDSVFNVSVKNVDKVSYPKVVVGFNDSLFKLENKLTKVLSDEVLNLTFTVKNVSNGFYFTTFNYSISGWTGFSKVVLLVNNGSGPVISVSGLGNITTGGVLDLVVNVSGESPKHNLSYGVATLDGEFLLVKSGVIDNNTPVRIRIPIPVIAVTGTYVFLVESEGSVSGGLFTIKTPLPVWFLIVLGIVLLLLTIGFLKFVSENREVKNLEE